MLMTETTKSDVACSWKRNFFKRTGVACAGVVSLAAVAMAGILKMYFIKSWVIDFGEVECCLSGLRED